MVTLRLLGNSPPLLSEIFIWLRKTSVAKEALMLLRKTRLLMNNLSLLRKNSVAKGKHFVARVITALLGNSLGS